VKVFDTHKTMDYTALKLSRFDRVPERDGRMDGRTDGRTDRQTDRQTGIIAVSMSRVIPVKFMLATAAATNGVLYVSSTVKNFPA